MLIGFFSDNVILDGLLIWGALLVGVVFFVVDKRRGIGALTLAYFLNLSIGHVPGLLACVNPNLMRCDFEDTSLGFDLTLVGMIAFIVGATAARMFPGRTKSVKAYQQFTDIGHFSRTSWRVLTIGIVCYFFLLPISALVPSLTAITSALGTLLILGFWLKVYGAVTTSNGREILFVLALMPLLPLITLATGGFIGFGTSWAVSVLAFCFVITRRRIWFYLAAPPVIILGLSLFVTYYQQRTDIRKLIWYEDSSMFQRVDKISGLVTDFQLLDLSNGDHLDALDQRLNQNMLVGLGVSRYQRGEAELSYGGTVPLWALIPRAVWPDKPNVSGGQELVAVFTGAHFEEGTSVAAGQVLEFFINFAVPGVLIGFAVFGFILMRLDQAAMRAFAMRDIHGVTQIVMPGLALLQPLNNLLGVVVAVAASIVASQVLIRSNLLLIKQRKASPATQAKMSGQTTRANVRW
jgi:hypothetical protein